MSDGVWGGRWCIGSVVSLTCLLFLGCSGRDGSQGVVRDGGGEPVAGALVTLRHGESGVATTVYSDARGRFSFPSDLSAPGTLEARSAVAESEPRVIVPVDDGAADLVLGPVPEDTEPRASSFLAQLPDGERKRRMVVDCGGCHVFDSPRMRLDGGGRLAEEWTAALQLMLATAGQGTGFPIISGDWDPAEDGQWFADALGGRPWPRDGRFPEDLVPSGAVLTEYDVPEPLDLAHDLAVDEAGRVIVTGMFTHRMYVLDPASGQIDVVAIPVENANPRAVDIDDTGRWWVLLGAPMQIASYDPAAASWRSFPLGEYPHSIALDSQGRIWFNGHFSLSPEVVGWLDPETGAVERYAVPHQPGDAESTIPYGLRVGPGDVIWGTQLRGNRLVRMASDGSDVRVFDFPTSHSGPRRPDVGPDGTVWIPTYGANSLVRFDPDAEVFREFPFPVGDAAPYVVRVDQTRGTVWIGTGQGDVMASFDPTSEAFTLYPLPTRGALVRHLDIDEATGAVWAAYSASPGVPGKILRIEPAQ